MEKEHIYREGRSERGVTPECLDSTRESVELRSRPRDPFRPRCPLPPMPHLGSFSLLRSVRPPIYSRFFVVFAYGGRVIMVLHALLDPPFSFLLQETHLRLYRPDCRPVRLSPFVSFLPSAGEPEVNSSPPNDKIVRFCQLPHRSLLVSSSNRGQHWRDFVSIISSLDIVYNFLPRNEGRSALRCWIFRNILRQTYNKRFTG